MLKTFILDTFASENTIQPMFFYFFCIVLYFNTRILINNATCLSILVKNAMVFQCIAIAHKDGEGGDRSKQVIFVVLEVPGGFKQLREA